MHPEQAPPDTAHWGRAVKRRAQDLGLKLSYVADQVGTTPRNLSKWLSRVRMPRINDLKRKKLARVLRIEVEQLDQLALTDCRDKGRAA